MADLETTQSKLRSTPTAGVSGEHSAYYRRLLSAGYKGYIQGSIGGGTLYGAIGLGIGAVVGVPLMVISGGTALPLLLIPALGTTLGLYGAHAFADIGKTAAIIADSADTNEKRRYLLDRYYETPNEQEAQEIKRQLEEEHQPKAPEKIFHWRPAIMGALIGITLAVVVIALAPQFAPHFIPEILGFLGVGGGHAAAAGAATVVAEGASAAAPLVAHGMGLAAPVAMAAGAAIGGLAGSVIGIDREYIRRWLDKSEFAIHETGKAEKEIAAREMDIQRITEAAKRGEPMASHATAEGAPPVEKIHVSDMGHPTTPSLERGTRIDPISPQAIAGIKVMPSTQVSAPIHAERVADFHQAISH